MEKENLIKDALENLYGYRIVKQIGARYKDIEFHVAGGAIRNILLGLNKVSDVDFFLFFENGNKFIFNELVAELGEFGTVDYGQYGSPRWYYEGGDGNYFDIVPYIKFDVGFGNPKTISETLNQFDFTANAVGYNIFTQQVCNPVGGISDIDNRVLKAVRLDFSDDFVSDKIHFSRLSVLWFRLIHYASSLNFKIDSITLKWLKENSYRLEDVNEFEKYFFKPVVNTHLLWP